MIEQAWHYTTGEKFIEIVDSGFLRTTLAGCPEHEKPVLWFSLNQNWEPTANKGILEPIGGRLHHRTATKEETRKMGGGLVRFGYSASLLVPWLELWKRAGILPAHMRALEKVGRGGGANPYHWMGSFEPIPVSELVIEVINHLGEWVRVQERLAA